MSHGPHTSGPLKATAAALSLLPLAFPTRVQAQAPADARLQMQTLPWPAELPSPPDPNAHEFITPKSNDLLDFHGSIQNPHLVIFQVGTF